MSVRDMNFMENLVKLEISPPSPLKRGRVELDSDIIHETGVFKYNLDLLPRAKELRENPTRTEQELWDQILRSKKTGYKFTRQKPIDNFILDFYCSELLFAIEVDGEIHRKQQDYDQARTKLLNCYGIEVIRFSNQEILNDINTVKSTIAKHIKTKNQTPP